MTHLVAIVVGRDEKPVSSDNPMPVTGALTGALPAGTAAIGNVGTSPLAAQLTPAAISFSASGDNTVVAGVSAKTVKIYRLILTIAGATVLTFKSGAGTSLTGAMALNAGGSITLDFTSEPWFTTATAAAFVINSTNAVQVSGKVDSLTS